VVCAGERATGVEARWILGVRLLRILGVRLLRIQGLRLLRILGVRLLRILGVRLLYRIQESDPLILSRDDLDSSTPRCALRSE
jgi:hypothetical protein